MKALILSLSLASLLGAGCSRTAPLQPPPPMPAGGTAQTTEGAIMNALNKRGWLVQQRYAGAIDAMYAPRKHRLFVRIVYDQRAVQIYYVGSEGLQESREGQTIYIHPNANKWLKNLQSDIALSLQEASYQGAPPPPPMAPGMAPPPPGGVAPAPGAAPPPPGR
jgi:hypothetical protein